MAVDEQRLLVDDDAANGSTARYERTADVGVSAAPKMTSRFHALDAFRGLVVCLMIFVDDAGQAYQDRFNHSPWNGLRIADVVMPAFLFTVGSAAGLAIQSQLAAGKTKPMIMKAACLRGLRLFGLGIFLQGGRFPDQYGLVQLRIPGILQRIALVYVVVVALDLFGAANGTAQNHLRRYKRQYVAMASIISLYWVLLMVAYFVMPCRPSPIAPTPDCNAQFFWDKLIFGQNHLFNSPEYLRIEECSSCSPGLCPRFDTPDWCLRPFDPEGFTSSLISIASGFTGLQVAHVYSDGLARSGSGPNKTEWFYNALRNFLFAFISFFVGIPFNKNLYSLSYMLLTNFLNITILSIIYIAFESTGQMYWLHPMVAIGRNAILVFALGACGIVDAMLKWVYWSRPVENIVTFGLVACARIFGPDLGLVVFVLIKVAFWTGIALYLDRHGKYYTI